MRIYGAWAGNPRGIEENETRCVASISGGFIFHQCSRKRGYGKNKEYCKQHSEMDLVYTPEHKKINE